MRHAWDIVVRLRPTIFVAALAFLILSQPQQMLELYLIDIENVLSRQIELGTEGQLSLWAFLTAGRPIVTAIVCGILTISMLGLGSVHLLALCRDMEAGPPVWLRTMLCALLVVLTASAPMLGIAIGLENARQELPRIDQSEVSAALLRAVANYQWLTLGMLAGVVSAFGIVFLLLRRWLERISGHVFSLPGFVFGAAAIVLFSLAIVQSPTALPWAIGTQALVLIFLAALAFVLVSFSHAYRLSGVPVTVLVLAAALTFSALGWTDNHKVDHKIGGAPTRVEQGFDAWLRARGDLGFYAAKGKPYPIYLVAAEGGGIYAGYHVASFLARMQATCPHFAQHVFAISSVSGGSLGAAVFAAQVHRGADGIRNKPIEGAGCEREVVQEGEIVEGTSEFFRRDFLAPLVASTLFPDVLQRLIPFPIRAFDRARGLERAFIDARAAHWAALERPNPFEESINALWRPDGATPALFLNTTSVEMGARVTIGPLIDNATPTAVHISSLLCDSTRAIDVPLAAAVSISARFPWLTPAGWLANDEQDTGICGPAAVKRTATSSRKRDRLYLVDGGYFENSGLETTVEMATRLRALDRECRQVRAGRLPDSLRTCEGLPAAGFEVRTIMVFAMDEFAKQWWSNSADLTDDYPGELAAPLRTMLNTRRSRTRVVHSRQVHFDDDYNHMGTIDPQQLKAFGRYGIEGMTFLGHDDIHHVMLDGISKFLPLGWRLSHRSMVNIAESVTTPTAITFELIRRELMGEETASVKHPPGAANR